jgi:gluconokinase
VTPCLKDPLDTPEETNRFFNLENPEGNLLFLPYIQGERAPVWDAEAKGIFFGIDSSHTITDFQYAIGEGLCYSLRQLVKLSDRLHGPSDSIILSGGLSNSEHFTRLLATVLNTEITISDDADASAMVRVSLVGKPWVLLTDMINSCLKVLLLIV